MKPYATDNICAGTCPFHNAVTPSSFMIDWNACRIPQYLENDVLVGLHTGSTWSYKKSETKVKSCHKKDNSIL